MKASVIIPTYNRGEYFNRALQSAAELDFPKANYEIIIVDSNTADISQSNLDVYRKKGHHIVYLKEPRLSFTLARHAAAQAAGSDILCYMDDDAVADKNWLRGTVELFDKDPAVGMVAGRIEPLFEHEPPAWAVRVQKKFNGWSLWNYSDKECESPGACGPSLAVRKSVLDQVGGFPPDTIGGESFLTGTIEKILIGPGDWGLSRAVKRAGYKIMFSPQVKVHHAVPAMRMTERWWRQRFVGEGYMTAFTEQVWNPRGPAGLCFKAAKDVILGAGGRVVSWMLSFLKNDFAYLYDFGASYMMTRAKVEMALAKDPDLAKRLWDVGLRGIQPGEIDEIKRWIP